MGRESTGEIEVRGPWIASSYYRDDSGDEKFDRGWLRTGDIASVQVNGSVQITDRSKDVIKSGGEWISSVELENEVMSHPDVIEAAVIAKPDERWAERPLCCVVLREGAGHDRRGSPRAPPRPSCQVVAAGRVRVHRRGAQDERRQVRQEGAAGAPQRGRTRGKGRGALSEAPIRRVAPMRRRHASTGICPRLEDGRRCSRRVPVPARARVYACPRRREYRCVPGPPTRARAWKRDPRSCSDGST